MSRSHAFTGARAVFVGSLKVLAAVALIVGTFVAVAYILWAAFTD